MGVNTQHENEPNESVQDVEAKSTSLDDTPNENSACADHIQEEMIERVNEDVNTRDITGEGDYTTSLGVTVNQTVTTTYSTAESDKDLDEKTEEFQSLLKEIENTSTVNDNDGENVHERDLCDNDDPVEDKSKIPVDTGWAWAILFAGTLEMFIVIGVMRCYGIFFLEFQQKFQSTSSVTSLISTLQNVTYSITGLFVMTVGLRFISARNSVMIGGLMTGIAYVITAYLENLGAVLFINGILVGFTLSFVYGPTVAMLSTYFEKYRGLANSISCAGVSLGGLILAPLFTYLFEHYGYSGTLLLTAGVHLNIIVGGMLLRPTEFYSRRNSSQIGSNYETENKHTEDKIPLNTKNSKVSIANGNISKPNLEANGTNEACETDECNIQLSLEHSPMSKSDNDRYLFPMHRKKAVLERQLSTRSNTSLEAVSAILNTSVSKYASAHFINGSSQNMYNSGMNLKDNKQKEIDKNDIKKLLATVFDFSILKDRLFLYYLLCTVFLCAGNGITPFYLAPHAKDIGMDPESTAAVLMVVNIVDLFARIIFGFVSDKDWIKRSTLIALSSAILGVANCLVYFVSCYVTIMVFAVIIGLLQGIYFSLYAVVIVDYLSLEKLNNALGFCTAFQGLSIGCALPVAGYLRDVSGTYVTSYAFIGSLLLIGTVLTLMLPVVQRWQQRHNDSKKSP